MKRTYKRRSANIIHAALNNSVATGGEVNLFSGDISELIEVMKKVKPDTKEYYLEYSNQPDEKTALNRLAAGDIDTFKRYEKHVKKQHLKLKGTAAKEYQFDTEGLFFDTAEFLTGAPEYWLNETDSTAPAPPKDILINLSCPGSTNETTIFNKLIQIIALIDAAESEGQRLNVKAVAYCQSYDKRNTPIGTFEVEVKRAQDPINIQQLVYLFANPILFRYCRFSLQKENKNLGYDSTNSISYLTKEKEQMKRKDIIYIPSIYYDKEIGILNYTTTNIIEKYEIEL